MEGVSFSSVLTCLIFFNPIWIENMKEELELFLSYFVFFALFFLAFAFYRSTLFEEYHLGAVHYSSAIIQALIVSKLILLGQKFKIGSKFFHAPFFLGVVYRSILFCAFVFIMIAVEKMIEGRLEGKSFIQAYEHLIDIGYYEILGRIGVVFFVFIPFFSFLGLADRMGKKNLYEIFWGK